MVISQMLYDFSPVYNFGVGVKSSKIDFSWVKSMIIYRRYANRFLILNVDFATRCSCRQTCNKLLMSVDFAIFACLVKSIFESNGAWINFDLTNYSSGSHIHILAFMGKDILVKKFVGRTILCWQTSFNFGQLQLF